MHTGLLRECKPPELFGSRPAHQQAIRPSHTATQQHLRRSRQIRQQHSVLWSSREPPSACCMAGRDSAVPSKGITLAQFVADSRLEDAADLALVFSAFEGAVKQIAGRISRAGIEGLFGAEHCLHNGSERDAPKKLDVVANDILKAALASSGRIAAMATEEDDSAIAVDAENDRVAASAGAAPPFAAVFDPLDGSSNIDACIPTGTILGLYEAKGSPEESVMQPGRQQIAAAYALYSSATMIVASLGAGTFGFTLDPHCGHFLLTHHICIPARGQMYSLNDARHFDWPEGLRRYVDAIRQGRGQTGKQYSARYVCSLVADFHRTLLYGGWAANPRNHLRLVYEANPLSFLAEQAGGRGSTGKDRVLDIQPEKLHQRLPLFLGSPDDIAELESYGDVQQLGSKKYSV